MLWSGCAFASIGCTGSTRFVVQGPVSYVGKRVGTFDVKEGGRIAFGYTPAEACQLLLTDEQRLQLANGAEPLGPRDRTIGGE